MIDRGGTFRVQSLEENVTLDTYSCPFRHGYPRAVRWEGIP
jgi:hypothetical protein